MAISIFTTVLIERFLQENKARVLAGVQHIDLHREFQPLTNEVIPRPEFARVFLDWVDTQVWTVPLDPVTAQEIRHIVELTLLNPPTDDFMYNFHTSPVNHLLDVVMSQCELAWFVDREDIQKAIRGFLDDIQPSDVTP
ncbi:hypothetical protein [Janthinobacterium sp.]|uniref:hypothetical protein n=1 Tax=Janthinobacterium sp. TaxID=1871054 RepID=UPI002636990D|nr:hypothetical protein [Janthinobacterium sp.]